MADTMASPPKRMTRARTAAKSAAVDDLTNIKVTKASAAKAKLAIATAASRRKAPVLEPQDVVMEEEVPVKTTKKRGATKVVKVPEEGIDAGKVTRGTGSRGSVRGRKTPVLEERDEVEMTDVEGPKTRGKPKITSKAADTEAAKKTARGRANIVVTLPMPAEEVITIERPTRARGTATGPTASTRSRAATSGVSKAAPKKKVTFQDMPEQEDQENKPLATETKAKKAVATGLKAKPVRKPASTRGRKPATRSKIGAAAQDNDSKPLSPKKVTQIAKSNSSVSSDDELCGAKTPIKPLSKSPIKVSMGMLGSIRASGAARKLDFAPAIAPSSPSKSVAPASSDLSASPARRPPPSPFKDSLKESPRRGVDLPKPIAPPSFKLSASPLKASLLQSPARRPVSPQKLGVSWTSPAKSASVVFESPEKEETVASVFDQSTIVLSNTSFDKPDTMITTHFRSSPERSAKVHKMTEQELAEESSSPTKIGSAMEGVVMTSSQASVEEQENTVIVEQRDLDEAMVESCSTVQVPATSSPASQTTDDLLTGDIGSAISVRSTIPSNSPLLSDSPLASVAPFTTSSAWKHRDDGEESEDELQSDCTLSQFSLSSKARLSTSGTPFQNTKLNRGTFNLDTPATALARSSKGLGMTPLAVKLSGWLASSPEKNKQSNFSRGIFSPAIAEALKPRANSRLSTGSVLKETPPKSSFFEDEMAVRDLGDEVDDLSVVEEDAMVLVRETLPSEEEGPANTQLSQASEASEVYGDENEPAQVHSTPIDPLLLIPHQEQVPVTYETPRRPAQSALRVVHTVSKVPLKPAADVSPIKIPKKRSRSLSGAGSPRKSPPSPGITRSISTNSISQEAKESFASEGDEDEHTENNQPGMVIGSTDPGIDNALTTATPAKTPSRNTDSQVLQGAVVFVDVHTTEGADASGIFIDLLTQMGARCVKHWNWNPRANINVPRDAAFDYEAAIEEAREASTPGGKVGITHVVFKDGGKRTLEKVRDSKGVVLCVGVGWVLDCERHNKWLEESDYAVDTSYTPRGGSRRRKSMEPRALANINGNLVPSDSSFFKAPPAEQSPTREFLNLMSPSNSPITPESGLVFPSNEQIDGPETPLRPETYPLPDTPFMNSPTTPYYLSKGAQLVQQTCPPKQTGERLFPVSGRIEDQPDESVRQRLLLARRKSMQFAPRVNSPLGRIN